MRFNWFSKFAHSDESVDDIENIDADIPIRSASEDLLSRAHFAKRIAQLLSVPGSREGRVFAIRGGWGYGKSSLKNLVIEALETTSPRAVYLEFNPWQWGDGDSIARALFGQLAGTLGGVHGSEAKRRAKALRRYGNILVGSSGSLTKVSDEKGLSHWLNSAALVGAAVGIATPSPSVKILAAIALGLAGVTMAIGRLLNWAGKDRSSTPLDEVREDVETRLRKLHRPIVIFVDDIDRLEPDQIRLLFRQIKVNANLPNLLFVLLFQPSIVENALEPVAGTEGRQFLEKIVQAHFDLPPIAPEQLFKIFGVQLSDLLASLMGPENGFNQRRWGNLAIGAIQPCIRNLRDIKRVLSSIDIHLPMHQGEKVFEVNILDFISLEVMRVFEPQLHAALATNRQLLLQTGRFSGDNRDQRDREALNYILELIDPSRRKSWEIMLKELFPTVEWAMGGMNYDKADWVSDWAREKRVCTERSFDRYFMLQLPEGAMSESDFAAFLESAADQAAIAKMIGELRRRGLLSALASRLDESVDELPLEYFDNLFNAIVLLGEEMGGQPGLRDPFNTPFLSCWRAASWYLRRLNSPEDRSHALLRAMEATESLSVPAVLISLDMDRRKEVESKNEAAFDDAGLEDLKLRWVDLIKDRIADIEVMLGDDMLVSHLYRWRDFSVLGVKETRELVANLSGDDRQLTQLLMRFLLIGSQQTFGDHVATKTESFRRETLSDFFDLDELQRRLKELPRSRLEPEQQRVLGILDRYFEHWNSGGSDDLLHQ